MLILSVSSTTFIACQKNTGAESSEQQFTDEDLVNGILFLNGSFVNSVPELRDASELVDATIKEKIGEVEFRKTVLKRNEAYGNIISTAKRLNPNFTRSFAEKIQTKNPQIISEAIQEANKLLYSASLMYFYQDQAKADNVGDKIEELYLKDSEKLSTLLAKISDENVNGEEIGRYVASLMDENNFSGEKSTILSDIEDPNVQPACLAVALNVGAFVNIGMILNVVALVNVEVGFVVHQAAAAYTYTAIDTEFARRANGLNQERLVASIAKAI